MSLFFIFLRFGKVTAKSSGSVFSTPKTQTQPVFFLPNRITDHNQDQYNSVPDRKSFYRTRMYGQMLILTITTLKYFLKLFPLHFNTYVMGLRPI